MLMYSPVHPFDFHSLMYPFTDVFVYLFIHLFIIYYLFID